MRLLIDVGNTGIKWALVSMQEGEIALMQSVRHEKRWKEVFHEIALSVGNEAVSEIIAASVMTEADSYQLSACVESQFSLPLNFYRTEKKFHEFTNSYQEYARLGVDRWLAILEAWHRHGASVVIDCGSALTVDVASSRGEHLGGYIVPGLRMLVKALSSETSRVKVELSKEADIKLANSTERAVNNGCIKMCADFINQTLDDIKAEHGVCTIYLTGGDAQVLSQFVCADVLIDHTLVLSGLERVTRKHFEEG